MRVSNAVMLRALTRGEAQPSIQFRKTWKLCGGGMEEGKAGEGHYEVCPG